MKKRTLWITVLLLCQVLTLSGMGVLWVLTDTLGKEIHLQAKMVDPIDMFHGDYLDLEYSINKIPVSKWKGQQDQVTNNYNRPVYVALIPVKSNLWEAKGVYPSQLPSSNTYIVLKAQSRGVYDGKINLIYNTEHYYFPQGKAPQISENRPLRVTIKVAPWGQTRIMGIDKI